MTATCQAFGVARSTYYRKLRPAPVPMRRPSPVQILSVSGQETYEYSTHDAQRKDVAVQILSVSGQNTYEYSTHDA